MNSSETERLQKLIQKTQEAQQDVQAIIRRLERENRLLLASNWVLLILAFGLIARSIFHR